MGNAERLLESTRAAGLHLEGAGSLRLFDAAGKVTDRWPAVAPETRGR